MCRPAGAMVQVTDTYATGVRAVCFGFDGGICRVDGRSLQRGGGHAVRGGRRIL
jgi:hypothetical protein